MRPRRWEIRAAAAHVTRADAERLRDIYREEYGPQGYDVLLVARVVQAAQASVTVWVVVARRPESPR